MANQIQAQDTWPLEVYQIGQTDPVFGGPTGPVNVMGAELATRALYQRMRNVTPWSIDLSQLPGGYRSGACVMHGGVSWRSTVDDNTAQPGTDAAKWERWAYSESELAAYLRGSILSPVRCPVTGPAANPSNASPYTMWRSVAPYNEYWMWMGDAWKVIAERIAMQAGVASIAAAGGSIYGVSSLPAAPRSGRAYLRGLVSNLNGASGGNQMQAYIIRVRGGVSSNVIESFSECTVTNINQYMQARPLALVDVLAGDTHQLVAISSGARLVSPDSGSGIYLEYQ